MLRIVSLIIAITLSGWAILFLTGYNVSPKYTGTVTFTVSNQVELTWQQLINIKETPTRKGDVASVEILEEYGKLIAWREDLKNGGYRIYRMNKRIENQELVVELTESSDGVTGIWTFDLWKENQDTVVQISEESTSTDVLRRGYHVLFGRNYNLLVWQKYIKVGLVEALLRTP